jgi:hypothetical protein
MDTRDYESPQYLSGDVLIGSPAESPITPMRIVSMCNPVRKLTIYTAFGLIASMIFLSVFGVARAGISSDTAASPVGKICKPSEEPVGWPKPLGVHRDGNVAMAVTSEGLYGQSIAGGYADPETGLPAPWFVFPASSGIKYLHAGALWIGGVVNGDTLVSLGFDSRSVSRSDFQPEDPEKGGVVLTGGPADKCFVSTYSDTGEDHYSRPDLNSLAVIEKSYSWSSPPYDDFIICELCIRNIGTDPIYGTWVGFYVDGDVMPVGDISGGWRDDNVSYHHNSGTAYIMDTDGDPLINGGYSWDSLSIRGAMGLKLLDMNPPATDSSFNWWLPYASSELDWGPRYIGDGSEPLYTFSTGGNGMPVTDQDQYHILSNSEMDYDLLWTEVMKDNPEWLSPPSDLGYIFQGRDIRFVYSFGSYDLFPGDSIEMAVVFVGGDNIHQDPSAFYEVYDPYMPEFYYLELDFSDLVSNGTAAQLLYDSEYLPAPPVGRVQGVEVVETANNFATIKWLAREHPDVLGYNIYIKPVPEGQALFGDTVVGYRDTTGMMLWNPQSPVSDLQYTIDGLADGEMYLASVATVAEGVMGRMSYPIYFSCGVPRPPDLLDRTLYLHNIDVVTFDWAPSPDEDIDHYNIYRCISYFEYARSYDHTIGLYPIYQDDTCDSVAQFIENGDTTMYYFFRMEPYESVPAVVTSFSDSIIHEELYYSVTAVDSLGRESEMTDFVRVFARGCPHKDFLIYLPNDGSNSNFQSIDSVIIFYETALEGYDYDFFFMSDSSGINGCPNHTCMGWPTMAPYRFVVIDDHIRSSLLESEVYMPFKDVLTEYTRSNGNVIYFGSLNAGCSAVDIDTLKRTYGPGTFEYDILHLDSSLTCGFALFWKGIVTTEDTIGGLISAESVDDGYPNLEVDTNYYWWNSESYRIMSWPIATPPLTGNLYPDQQAQVIFEYRSLFPGASRCEGLPCGVKYQDGDHCVYTFAFHPWFIRMEDFKELINAIYADYPTDVAEDSPPLPRGLTLYQNYPNPFNPVTNIRFNLPRSASVCLDIYDILGRKVTTLVDDLCRPGLHSVTWNGTDARGHSVASGVYFYRLRADGRAVTRKMVILK